MRVFNPFRTKIPGTTDTPEARIRRATQEAYRQFDRDKAPTRTEWEQDHVRQTPSGKPVGRHSRKTQGVPVYGIHE